MNADTDADFAGYVVGLEMLHTAAVVYVHDRPREVWNAIGSALVRAQREQASPVLTPFETSLLEALVIIHLNMDAEVVTGRSET